jgi:hypothetical protein
LGMQFWRTGPEKRRLSMQYLQVSFWIYFSELIWFYPFLLILKQLVLAGVAYRITKDCSKGRISKCGCDLTMPRNYVRPNHDGGYSYRGCSDNVQYGIALASEFVDSVCFLNVYLEGVFQAQQL